MLSEFYKNASGCGWEVIKVIRVPPSANFIDYSGLDVRDSKVGPGRARAVVVAPSRLGERRHAGRRAGLASPGAGERGRFARRRRRCTSLNPLVS